MSATLLLNKTRDFYDYVQLIYNIKWNLNLLKEFRKLTIIKKFKKAYSKNKFLKLFNSLYI